MKCCSMLHNMVHADGSVLQTFDYLKQNGLQGFVDIWPRPTAIAWKTIACYAAFEALLQLALPGKRVEGPISPAGNVPVYKMVFGKLKTIRKGRSAPSSTGSGSSGNPIIDFYWLLVFCVYTSTTTATGKDKNSAEQMESAWCGEELHQRLSPPIKLARGRPKLAFF
ncbi:hypothetical protein C5167_033936 [Papaver somniferum]|uniref:Uncharacterized protein n=1 Tax=Papaver somniferum TaxID=3469 RepID=A0A4Y7KEI5_PAPSO|nr:hypothetical protein C5167_033936 [Papaver somniferum]